ncbi:MAG TPA: alpha/beta hydrolase [Actinomycetospora sp.]|uniref:alpha/beta hydrolase n=1 Tax=Actinomycetospora sp. TaxID=1872135 RepID=UPI002F3FAE5F
MTTTETFQTVVYTSSPASELALDVFRPTAESRHCAVLLFHGGGWRAGSKEAVHAQAAALAGSGFTALAVQYRLLDAAAWPAPLHDATAALDWTRAHADDLGIDPGRVVMQGHSAGGHIALMTGTLDADRRPAAIAAYYPAIGFHRSDTPPAPPQPGQLPNVAVDDLGRLPSWMLFGPGSAQDDLVAASPLDLVDAWFPPTIILHGAADRLYPFRSSISLHQRLTELGVSTDLHLYADRDHAFERAPSMTAATADAVRSFLQRTVTDKAEIDDEARRYPFPPGRP